MIDVPAAAGHRSLTLSPPVPGATVRALSDLVPDARLIYGGVGLSVRQLLALLPPTGSQFDDGLPLPPVAVGLWTYCPATDSTEGECQTIQVTEGSRHRLGR